jgi:alpha/beta superfamily hydrolase
MPRRIESLFIPGPAGKLEALLEEPEDAAPREAALVCHPHPQHGGSMHNKVVYRIARAMRRAGCVVLRFNYRGVNLSEGKYDDGVGETEDARAALAFLRGRYPNLPFSMAGFSFGSRIILRLGCEIPGARQLVAVGFPAAMPKSAGLGECTVLRVFIISRNDEFCPLPAMEEYFASLPEPKRLIWIEAEDHFFAGALDELEAKIVQIAMPLKSLHAIWSINGGKLRQFERLTNEALLHSLEPGQPGSLKARPDGTLLDGHHRVEVLRARGVNVDVLPREIVHKSNLEGE